MPNKINTLFLFLEKESVSRLDETDFFLRGLLIFERKIFLKVTF